ncbi:hypothetical protein MKW92_038823 [Papaver armeniacum]|nr:hypothetical protein MKW92_038823 [Papaver armeniacum]
MKKRQKGIELILNTFDPIEQVFKFQGKKFRSTPETLAVIFGLQRIKGGAELTMMDYPRPEIPVAQIVFCETYFKTRPAIQKRDILDSLYATAGDVSKPDDFVKLLVLYLCNTVFFATVGGNKMPKLYLNYIFAMDQVSWPDLIHSHLMEALMEAEKPYDSLKGCTIYILFWFAEVTHFISKIEGELGNCKPRFLRWNTMALVQKMKKEGITSLEQDLSGSFIDPLDKDEQSLMTPIEIRQANSDRIGKKVVRNRDSDEDWELSPDRDSDEDWELSPDRDAARCVEDLAHVNFSKKRKRGMEVSRPCEGKGICRDLHGNDVHIGNLSSSSEAKTTGIELLEVGELVGEPVDAAIKTCSSNCLTPDSTLLTKSPSFTGSSSALVQERAEGSDFLDIFNIPEENENDRPHTSGASAQERMEEFEFVDNFKIPKEYVKLYKNLHGKYGHIATKKVMKNSDIILACVTNLLKIISAMETKLGVELSEELLEEWEGFIKDAEALKFNIKWLREGFNQLTNHWLSSLGRNYVGLWTRRDELKTEHPEINIGISKAEAKISCKRETVQKINFQSKTVLEMLLNF